MLLLATLLVDSKDAATFVKLSSYNCHRMSLGITSLWYAFQSLGMIYLPDCLCLHHTLGRHGKQRQRLHWTRGVCFHLFLGYGLKFNKNIEYHLT